MIKTKKSPDTTKVKIVSIVPVRILSASNYTVTALDKADTAQVTASVKGAETKCSTQPNDKKQS